MDDVQAALAHARMRFDQGDQPAARKQLEALLGKAKKTRDAALVEEMLPVTRELAAKAEPRHADAYRRLVHALEQNAAYFERIGPAPPRADRWASRRRAAAMVGLCVIAPGLVIYASGNTTVAVIWTELGLFASPIAFFVRGERWSVSRWLCGVAALYVLGSAALCLLLLLVASASGVIALGLLVAVLAGTLGLVGCFVAGESLGVFVVCESFAVVGIAAALGLIHSDSETLHHVVSAPASQESVADWSSLYALWATGGLMIVSGLVLALTWERRGARMPNEDGAPTL